MMNLSKNSTGNKCLITMIVWFLAVNAVFAQTATVHTEQALVEALENARPGQTILLEEGLSLSRNIVISAGGTREDPIVIGAKVPGKTLVTSEIKLSGDHLVLTGLKFSGADGHVIIEGNGCRVSRCTFSDSKSTKWIQVRSGSSQVEIDHNLFENKTSNLTEKSCQLLQIRVNNENERHHIHHNLFRDIPPGSGNGYETVQLITEGNPFDPPEGHCNTVIENNLFIRCNGEAEIISVKSNGNLLRNNTFRACKGGLVLRHGDDNVVTGNYFFGDGEPGSGGVRLQGTGQVVANNYFHHLGQYGIAMMDGTPDDLYIRVEQATVAFNTFVNCPKIMAVGLNHSKHPNGTPPKDCRIIGNIFYTNSDFEKGQSIEFVQGDQPVGWQWQDNLANKKISSPGLPGIRKANPHLQFGEDQVAIPTKKTPETEWLSPMAATISTDIFGQRTSAVRTLGAIRFPVESRDNLPLTQEKVGPEAKIILPKK